MKTLEQKLKEISPKRQAKIEARTRQLVAREMSLRDLRHAVNKTQTTVARLSIWARMAFLIWRSEATCCSPPYEIMWRRLAAA